MRRVMRKGCDVVVAALIVVIVGTAGLCAIVVALIARLASWAFRLG